MKKLILVLALSALSFAASATGFSLGGGTWSGKIDAGSSSVSVGGSQSETSATNTGFAANATLNATGGESKAWGAFNQQGVQTGTAQSSYSAGASGSLKFGSATSQTAGGQGTDVNSAAFGSFTKSGGGGFLGFGN